MRETEIDRVLGKLLALGAGLTSVFILSGLNTDPVNVTKLFVAGICGVAVGSISLILNFKKLVLENRYAVASSILFSVALVNSTLNSGAPLSQAIYGAYGRNTGLLAYLILLLILIGGLSLSSRKSIELSLYSLIAAGAVNILYCAWVLSFGDFIRWNNPYGNILGLFGNPNFISSFLGMFITGAAALIFKDGIKSQIRAILLLFAAVAFFEIVKSNAIQGLVVTAGGLVLVGFFVIRSRYQSPVISLLYSGIVSGLGIVAILGTLQKGPLIFLYKRSVSLRGTYWKTGINMGQEEPWTGVGMDSYGDWYRRLRPPIALIDTPGISTLSNASHNVVIDFFAYGGWPLLLSYLLIVALGAISIVRVTIRQQAYDPIFVGIASIWICYQVQSIISINQIGLAIWGWLFTGLLVAYDRIKVLDLQGKASDKISRINNRNGKPAHVFSAKMIGGIGGLIGALIALPPMNSDIKWFEAINSRNAQQVELALTPNYLNPANSFKYAQAVQLFQASGLNDLAHKYALQSVTYNPDYFDAWKQIYYLPNSTDSEKDWALQNMKRLDPNNPDPTKNYD